MRFVQFTALLLAACTEATSASATASRSAAASQPPIVVPSGSVERAAQRAIISRRPIAAERLLKAKLATGTAPSASAVLLAAEAATLRKAWPDVIALLRNQPWIDSAAGGYGHLLLARAALEQSPRSASFDSLASHHAEQATRHRDDMVRGSAVLMLARALDRARDDNAAAARYREAATALPDIHDWLLLRAAVVTADRSARRGLFDRVRDSVARTQIEATDLSARVRFGDTVLAPASAPIARPSSAPATMRTVSDSVARARTLVRAGKMSAGLAILQRVTRGVAAAPVNADSRRAEALATALYLVGDLSGEQQATTAWRTLWQRYPQHPLAARGAFRAGVLAWRRGAVAEAASWWQPLTMTTTTESLAARYWLARADARRGDARQARRAWQSLVADAPESYYAMLAAERLDTVPWRNVSPAAAGAAENEDSEDRRVSQLQLLDALGLDPEASAVRRDLLSRDAPAESLMFTAVALRREELASPAIRLAERARAGGVPAGDELYRTLFPLPFKDLIADWSDRVGVDAALVAAVIRQESRFTPTARSAADARGLMQLLPSVGKSLAAQNVDRPWALSLLYEPEINIPLGVRHLRQALRSDGGTHPAYALAAYNAGRSRLLRWRALPGAATDWELFVEQIPYVETRDYVRIVLRNREWYRALYPALRTANGTSDQEL